MLREKNLLLVGPYPPPYGGISSFITELEKGCQNSVKSFHVLHIGNQRENSISPLGSHINRVKLKSLSSLFVFIFINPIRLLKVVLLYLKNFKNGPVMYLGLLCQAILIVRYCEKNNIDLVTLFGTRQGGVLPYLSKLTVIPTCYCVFADPFKSPEFYEKHKNWFYAAFEGATKIFSSSEYCCKVTEVFSAELEAEVIYIGVDTDRFSPNLDCFASRDALAIPFEGPIVLAVARMEKEMGIADILQVADQILSENQETGFLLVGASGTETSRVLDFAAKRSDRVIARTDVPFDDLPLYYSSANVVIAPTVAKHACMGVSVKEAMSAGRATVVSNSGGLPEAVHDGFNGFVVDVGADGGVDVGRFAAALSGLIEDQELSTSFGKNGRKRAMELFSAEASVAKFQAIAVSAFEQFERDRV